MPKTHRRLDIRNVAIVAHVDHGKTTLVDAMLKQTGEFHVKTGGPQECVLDSNDLERERGITILSKITSVPFKDSTINIVDTPGHADFSNEVERILNMVEGVLLLVDAVDGPMPQTRYVLGKSLGMGLKPIVVINKVDRPEAKPFEALDKTFSLFMELGATDEQLDFPTLYASGRNGWASMDPTIASSDLKPLFEAVIKHIPPPPARLKEPFQMLVTMVSYDNFVGRLAIGRITSGEAKKNDPVNLFNAQGEVRPFKITKIIRTMGLEKREMEKISAGDLATLAGIENAKVGDTIASPEIDKPLPGLKVDEPTMVMEFMVNDSPFAGQDGEFLTTRHIRERLLHEEENSVGLKVEEIENSGSFRVAGRGELHLSILIETLRREGFELAVSKPKVIDRVIDGQIYEPAEYLVLDVDAQYQGAVLECLGERGAELKNMKVEGSRLRLDYLITARALFGLKNELLTFTRGKGLMHHSFYGVIPKKTADTSRRRGVLVSAEKGRTTAYALNNLQERGTLLVGPDTPVYAGMIVGESARDNTMEVNPCKKKALTNMRAAGSDDNIILSPPRNLSLEQALEFIEQDELVEITPKNIRLRKKILDPILRKRAQRRDEKQ